MSHLAPLRKPASLVGTYYQTKPASRQNGLYFILAMLGLTLALTGAIKETRWTGSALVYINGVAIEQDAFDFAMERLLIAKEQQALVAINFLIDEELLIQSAQKKGIIRTDNSIRKAIVNATIDQVKASVRTLTFNSKEFEQFWKQRKAFFLAKFESTTKARNIAWSEFKIRFPDIRLRQLLDRLRQQAEVKINPRVFADFKAPPDNIHELDSLLAPTTAALVNGYIIEAQLLARALDAQLENSNFPATTKNLNFSLDRIIEEELLYQYGLKSGLIKTSRAVRTLINKTMLEIITTSSIAQKGEQEATIAIGKELKKLRLSANIVWSLRAKALK